MAHAYESNIINYLILNNTHIGYSSGNPRQIMAEMAEFKPICSSFVPKLISRVCANIELKFSELKGCKKSIVQRALKTKLENRR